MKIKNKKTLYKKGSEELNRFNGRIGGNI